MNKKLLSYLVIVVMGLSLFATDIFAPGLPAMAREFGVPDASAKHTISAFFLAFAFGQLLIGPLSDIYGRRTVLIWSVSLLLSSTIVCALSTTLDALIIARLFQALGACAGGVVGRAMLSEVFEGSDLIRVMSTMVIVKAIAPAAAPILGGLLVPIAGWDSTFWALAILTAVVLILIVRFLPETKTTEESGTYIIRNLGSAYVRLAMNKDFLRYSIAPALLNGGLVALVASSPFIIISRHGVSEGVYGLLQGLHIVLFIVGATVSSRLAKSRRNDGDAERGIRPLLLGYCVFAAVMAMFARDAFGLLPVLGCTLTFCLVMGFTNPVLYARGMASFQGNAGTDSSVQGFIYYGVGAGVGTVSNFFATGSANSLFVLLASSAGLALIALFALRPRYVNRVAPE